MGVRFRAPVTRPANDHIRHQNAGVIQYVVVVIVLFYLKAQLCNALLWRATHKFLIKKPPHQVGGCYYPQNVILSVFTYFFDVFTHGANA